MANALNTYLGNLLKNPLGTKTTAPVSSAQSNFTNNFSSSPVPSNVGATSTKPTTITPPKTSSNPLTIQLPDSGQKYVQSQLSPTDPTNKYNTQTGQLNTSYSGYTAPSDPNTPTPNPTQNPTPSAPSATDAAFAEYIKSLQPSSAVTSAQSAYNDYVANQKTSISGLEGQGRGIPLSIVRGEQEKLLNQTQPEATRLQNDIGIAQDSASAISNAAKAKADYSLSKDSLARQSNKDALALKKPFSVGDNTYEYNPTTGQYENKGNNQSTTTSANSGFTLSPGESRYDANGKLIASGGPKPLSQAQETAQIANNEKQTAAQQSASQSIGIVNNLLQGDVYKNITGAAQGPLGLPFGTLGIFNQQAVNQYDQLQGLLKLGIRGLIKGQGAVSDYEGKILGQAASSLGRNLSNEDFKQALLKIRGTLQTNNGGETLVIVKDKNGKALGPATPLSGQDIYNAINDGNAIEYQ